MRAVRTATPLFAAIAFAATALAGCGSSTTTSSTAHYSAEIQKTFMTSCMATGGTSASCGCVLQKMEERFSQADFVTLDSLVSSSGAGGLPTADVAYLKAVAASCKKGS